MCSIVLRIASALLLILSFSNSAATIDNIIDCRTCYDDNAFVEESKRITELDTWKNVVALNSKTGSYVSKTMLKYIYRECEQTSEPDGDGGKLKICRDRERYLVNNLALDAEQVSAVHESAQYLNDYHNVAYAVGEVDLPGTLVGSAWDIHGEPGTLTAISDYYSSNYWYHAGLNILIVNGASVWNKVFGTTLNTNHYVRFNTDDGGYLLFEATYSLTTPAQLMLEFVKGNDGTNEIGADRTTILNGVYAFSDQASWEAFQHAITRYGIVVINPGSELLPTGTVYVTNCSGDDCLHPE